jgi:hypothetical protein
MTKPNKQAQEIAALKREVAELKAKVSPPESKFKPMSDAEWIDRMHQMREGRMSLAMPPSAVQYFADGVTNADCADIVRASHRPTGRPGMIPEQSSNVRGSNVAGSSTGWAREIPLSPPPGVAQADKLMDAQDAKDRAELIKQEAQTEAMRRFAEQTEIINKKLEAIGSKLAGQKR